MALPESFVKKLPSLWRIHRYFWPEVRKHRLLIAGSWMALLLEVGFRLLEPWPLKIVFDHLISKHHTHGYRVNFWDIFEPFTLLIMMAIATVAITALRALAGYCTTVGMAKIGNRVMLRIRAQIYRQLQFLSLSYHAKARSGDLVVRVIGDSAMLQDVVVTALLPLVAKTLILVGMIALMFHINWRLAIVAFSVFPLFWLRTTTVGRKINEASRLQRKREGAMAATASETISGIKTIQALSLESAFQNQFSRQSEKSMKQDVRAKRLAAGLERSVDVLTAISGALVLYFGTRLVLDRELSAGGLLVFFAYLKNVFRPVQDYAKYTTRLGKAAAAGERVLDLLNSVPEIRDLPDAVEAPPVRQQVQFENVSFSYDDERPVLRDINLTAKLGERIAIVGQSGSGKSTLVSLLLRLYDPRQGRVLMDGQDIRHFKLLSLRSQFSVVLQDNLLFAGTVRENIAYGAPAATNEQVEAAARLANAHDFIMAMPQGYETIVGERGVTLSHGQRQRLAIARAAIRNAPILILDEPMTGLDKKNEHAVLESLDRLGRNSITFLITHDLRHVHEADLVLFIEGGQIVERGTHEELLQAEGHYAALYRLQTSSRHVDRSAEALSISS